MRLDSPFVLAAAGTFAIHLILVVTFDAVTVLNPYQPAPPAPRVEMIDVEVPPPPEPPKPPPPPVAKEPEPEPEPVKTAPDPKPRPKVAARQETTPPPAEDTPPPVQDDPAPTGGDEVVQMEDIAPAARGVAVKPGKPNKGNIGRGGSGGGTGAGSGSGTADAPAPVSVATIKKAAMPKGDYGYFNTDEYPAAAKQLGIEGPIRVRLIVDTEGKVKQATLLNKLGHGLDEMALGRAKQIKFDPALDSLDRPVTSVVVWTFHMTLPK